MQSAAIAGCKGKFISMKRCSIIQASSLVWRDGAWWNLIRLTQAQISSKNYYIIDDDEKMLKNGNEKSFYRAKFIGRDFFECQYEWEAMIL